MIFSISNTYKNGVNFENWLPDILGLEHNEPESLSQKNTFLFTAFQQQEFKGKLIFTSEATTLLNPSLLVGIPIMDSWFSLIGDSNFQEKVIEETIKSISDKNYSKAEILNLVESDLKIQVGFALFRTHISSHTAVFYFQSKQFPHLNYCSVSKGLKGELKQLMKILNPEICDINSLIDFMYGQETRSLSFTAKQKLVLKDLITTGTGLARSGVSKYSQKGMSFNIQDGYCKSASISYNFFGFVIIVDFSFSALCHGAKNQLVLNKNQAKISLKSYYSKVEERGMLSKEEIHSVLDSCMDTIMDSLLKGYKELSL